MFGPSQDFKVVKDDLKDLKAEFRASFQQTSTQIQNLNRMIMMAFMNEKPDEN